MMFGSLLNALSTMVIGIYSANKAAGIATEKIEEWFKFVASLIGTVLVTFPFVWGSTILTAHTSGTNIWVSVVVGFASALVMTSVLIAFLWGRSPLTRGIPIAWPMKVSEKLLEGGFNLVVPAESQKPK